MSDITTRAREMTAALCAALEVAEAERTALRAEVERLRARRPVLCTRCWGDPLCCRECGGSGAVFVGGDEK